MQIGDGGVVVDFGHGLQLPLTPMVGEYANMTHFITDEDAVSDWKLSPALSVCIKLQHLRMVSSDWR